MAKFKPRERKHKIIKRSQHGGIKHTILDSNAAEILISGANNDGYLHQDQDRAQDAQFSVPSQKRRRMEKYIASKLKKEENAELIRKLASTKVDTSLYRSAKNLGSKRNDLVSEAFEISEDEFAGFDGPPPLQRGKADNITKWPSSEHHHLSSGANERAVTPVNTKNSLSVRVDSTETEPSTLIGIGLKQDLEFNDDGNPILPKRRRLKRSSIVHHASSEFSSVSVGIESENIQSYNNANSERHYLSESGFDEVSEDLKSQGTDDRSSSESNETEIGSDDGGSGVGTERQKTAGLPAHNARRSEAFKAWINDSRRQNSEHTNQSDLTANYKRLSERKAQGNHLVQRLSNNDEQLPVASQNPLNVPRRKVFTVSVQRPAVFQESRLSLPVVAEEQRIMEAIHNNPVVIIWGATGSGKTTQVPQFFYEAGYGSRNSMTPGVIGITQPRRVAAVSSANRVRAEFGNSSDKVSYQIRFDSTVSGRTAIKYMTDGILLREISQDVTLSKYSAIIIDEAHERSVNTDILIGMLSRIVDIRGSCNNVEGERRPLKLVIMSATLSVADFQSNTHLFRQGSPPVIKVEGRQYPVTIHFARSTKRDYMEEMFQKVCKAHKKLPPGGMLVFLTGQSEINTLLIRLREALSKSLTQQGTGGVDSTTSNMPQDVDDIEVDDDLISNISQSSRQEMMTDSDDEFELVNEDRLSTQEDVHVLPLYSQLPTKAQLRVFEEPPGNKRLIVLATNVAETSLTIPDIRYVFDCGRAKERKYDKVTGVQRFEVGWISKASANQRAGRAGRTYPGHVYRLYSSSVYERDFEDHTQPEILRTSIEGVVLQLKSMKLRNIIGFPFPTPPDKSDIEKAEKLLAYLGGLDSERNITTHGHALAKYPLSPRFAKMLCIGHQADCIYLTAATVAALVTRDIFATDAQSQQPSEPSDAAPAASKRPLGLIYSGLDKSTDFLKYFCAFAAFIWETNTRNDTDLEGFCNSAGLRFKAMKEAKQLWQQILRDVSRNHPGLCDMAPTLSMPTRKQTAALKQIVAAGFIDQIAIRADLSPNPPEIGRMPKRAIDMPYFTLFPSHEGRATTVEEKAVFLHPSSVLATKSVKELPHYIIYSHLQRSSSAGVIGQIMPKVRMHPLTSIQATQIVHLAQGTPLLKYSKPEYKTGWKFNQKSTYVTPSLVGEKGSTGWPLPAQIIS